jgi:hypothetical protein
MPSRTPELAAPLIPDDRDARKKYLLLACACDRVELALAWRKSSQPAHGLAGLVSNPWVHMATSALTPFLPRKFRAAAFLYRLWRSRK